MTWQERFVRPDSRFPSIYALCDENGDVRYIGKANDPAKRFKRHLNEAKHLNRPVHCWIRKIGRPTMIILESQCPNWIEAERRLIAEYRAKGSKLLNVADGGDVPSCTKEQRQNAARAATRARSAGPQHKVWRFNRDFTLAHRRGQLSPRIYAKLRELASIDPVNYGMWEGEEYAAR